jgi:hypothetical protein
MISEWNWIEYFKTLLHLSPYIVIGMVGVIIFLVKVKRLKI